MSGMSESGCNANIENQIEMNGPMELCRMEMPFYKIEENKGFWKTHCRANGNGVFVPTEMVWGREFPMLLSRPPTKMGQTKFAYSIKIAQSYRGRRERSTFFRKAKKSNATIHCQHFRVNRLLLTNFGVSQFTFNLHTEKNAHRCVVTHSILSVLLLTKRGSATDVCFT